ncbi:hypothetical protein D910_04684 [Dendroctonus ponderosae]|uniref:Transposase Helix-turn-helix domain-containing protein n=1 Tax=Dendroctonus ponderosae TaxID=77166 RepID=U4U092_DENPD|nr:hypothetical protein D910_04684 [Dendroctonus ponderosae]
MDANTVIISLLCEEEEQRKWVHEICKRRKLESEFATLFPQLIEHGEKLFQYFRMSYEKFQELLSIIKSDLTRENTTFAYYKRSIPPAERLAVTLRFLATGDSFKTISFSYRLGQTTVR